MFGDDRYGWKLGGALFLTAALFSLPGVRPKWNAPEVGHVLPAPGRWDGVALGLPDARVIRVEEGGVVIGDLTGELQVPGAADVEPQDRVGVRGPFRRGTDEGPHVEFRLVDVDEPRRATPGPSALANALPGNPLGKNPLAVSVRCWPHAN